MNAPVRTRPAPQRRRLVLAAAVALLVAALVVLGLVLAGSGDDPAGAAAAAPTSAPTTVEAAPVPPTPEPTGPTSDADAAPPSLPAVALDQPAAVGNGITAEVVSVEGIEGTGVGPGNVGGPALRVTVGITNGTAEPVSLDAVAVDLSYGSDDAPASPLEDASAAPFRGSVEPGGTAEGVYVFTIPADQRDDVTVSVGYQAGAPFLVFTGSAR